MFFSRAILAAENKRSFYVTARVKKEGVQALSLRLHKSTVKNVQGKYIFWQYCITGKFTLSLFSRFSDYIPVFRCFFSVLKSLSLWEKCRSIKTVHPCTVLMPSFVNKTRYCFVYPALLRRLFLQHSKILTGSMRKPPVSLLSFQDFFSQLTPCSKTPVFKGFL